MRQHLEMVIKRNPAMIIGIAECQQEIEQLLQGPAVAGDKTAPKDSLQHRDGYKYLTLRGQEESSVLIGARTEIAHTIKQLYWERRYDGDYRVGRGKKRAAYSRILIAGVELDKNVGFLGKNHNVLCMHMNNVLANGRWKKKLDKFWDWLSEKVKTFDVKVMMGDFNMSLFQVISELRSRGVEIDLGAWYPWKSPRGDPMSDSCGIFFINMPGEYTLEKGLPHLTADVPEGILHSKPRR